MNWTHVLYLKKASHIENFRSLRRICILISVHVLVFPNIGAAQSVTISVPPSQDLSGYTDHTNIQAAIDQAISAGPGSAVQLEPGTYFINGPLAMVNAQVALRGANWDLTVITNAPGRKFGNEALLPFIEIRLDSNWDFTQTSQILISDLTFRAIGPSGHKLYDDDVPIEGIRIYRDQDKIVKYEASFERIRFHGELGANYLAGTNLFRAIGLIEAGWWDLRPMQILLSVTGNDFANVGMSIDIWGLEDSYVQITDNSAPYIEGFGMELGDASNSVYEVTNNSFESMHSLIAWNGWALGTGRSQTIPKLSTWIFSHNSFDARFLSAIRLQDMARQVTGVVSMRATVSHNSLSLYGDGLWYWGAGVDAVTDGSNITNNKVTGVAPGSGSAFLIDGVRNSLIGNNARNFVGRADFAPILLVGYTQGNVVVGGGLLHDVIDEDDDPSTPEYDGGDILSGVSTRGGAGHAVSEAMAQRQQESSQQLEEACYPMCMPGN